MTTNVLSPAQWNWKELDVSPRESESDTEAAFDHVGIGRFAKDIAVLSIPMGLVAAFFGLWMSAKMADFKEAIASAIDRYAQTQTEVHKNFVTRPEWDAYMRLEEERHQQERKDNEEQNRLINKNNVLLERVAQKVGVRGLITEVP